MWGCFCARRGVKVTFSIREFFNSSKFNQKIQSDCFGLEEIPPDQKYIKCKRNKFPSSRKKKKKM